MWVIKYKTLHSYLGSYPFFIIKYITVKIKESSLETYITTEGWNFKIITAASNLYCKKQVHMWKGMSMMLQWLV